MVKLLVSRTQMRAAGLLPETNSSSYTLKRFNRPLFKYDGSYVHLRSLYKKGKVTPQPVSIEI